MLLWSLSREGIEKGGLAFKQGQREEPLSFSLLLFLIRKKLRQGVIFRKHGFGGYYFWTSWAFSIGLAFFPLSNFTICLWRDRGIKLNSSKGCSLTNALSGSSLTRDWLLIFQFRMSASLPFPSGGANKQLVLTRDAFKKIGSRLRNEKGRPLFVFYTSSKF